MNTPEETHSTVIIHSDRESGSDLKENGPEPDFSLLLSRVPYPRAQTCMHLYLKMHLVFENRCMQLYSNTKNILRKRHPLIFEHEMTLITIILTQRNQICKLFCFVTTIIVHITKNVPYA